MYKKARKYYTKQQIIAFSRLMPYQGIIEYMIPQIRLKVNLKKPQEKPRGRRKFHHLPRNLYYFVENFGVF